MDLFAVHPDRVDMAKVWKNIGHLLEEVCERSRGEITPESFRQAVEGGEADLWVIADTKREGIQRFRAIVGTTIAHTMSGMKVCNIILCAGRNRKEWLHLIDTLAGWARSEGCEKFRISARRGWVKDLSQFKIVGNDMEMDLGNGRKDGNHHEKPHRPGQVADASHQYGAGWRA